MRVPVRALPDGWLGLWKAADGKVVLIDRDGYRYAVTIAPKWDAPCYPRPEPQKPWKRTWKLPAEWSEDENLGMFLQVEAGTPGIGPTYRLAFLAHDSDGTTRLATARDPIQQIAAVPSIGAGVEGDADVPWAMPLADLSKCEPEDERRFRSAMRRR